MSPPIADMMVVAAGEARLKAYIRETFGPDATKYTAQNATEWLDVEAFGNWLRKTRNATHKTTR